MSRLAGVAAAMAMIGGAGFSSPLSGSKEHDGSKSSISRAERARRTAKNKSAKRQRMINRQRMKG